MNTELEKLDLSTLKSMYNKAVNELNFQLLRGADWTEVADRRILVTELSVALHHKLVTGNLNPAEHSSGEMKERH